MKTVSLGDRVVLLILFLFTLTDLEPIPEPVSDIDAARGTARFGDRF